MITVSFRNVAFAKNILDQICRVRSTYEKNPKETPRTIVARMGIAHVRGVESLIKNTITKNRIPNIEVSSEQIFFKYADLSDEEFEKEFNQLIQKNY